MLLTWMAMVSLMKSCASQICNPYVRHMSLMSKRPNRLPVPTGKSIVNQMEDLAPRLRVEPV